MPIFLRLTFFASALYSVAIFLGMVSGALGWDPSPFSFSFFDRELLSAGFPSAPWFEAVVHLGFSAAISFALWKRRPWSRYCILGFGGYLIAIGIFRFFFPSDEARVLNLLWILGPPIVYWYLFDKPNVVAYYSSLREGEGRQGE